MSVIVGILHETWALTVEMAPWLLLGFLMASLLSALVSARFVREHLGRPGLRQVVKAAILGVPLPLCSCGVLPVTASLRRHGASPGASIAFLISTPQTGMDSILATHALLGPVVMLFRVVTAFVSGILGGVLLELVNPRAAQYDVEQEPESPVEQLPVRSKARWVKAFRFGFRVLPRDIGRAMLLGIVISGVLTAVIPENYFADRLGAGHLLSMLLMLVVGIPLYVCSTGSIPLAFAMISMGISPGAALVFLVSGPATNAASLTTIWHMLGRRALVVYLGSIALCSVAAGQLLDLVMTRVPEGMQRAAHVHEHASPWEMVLGVALVLMLAPSLLPRR